MTLTPQDIQKFWIRAYLGTTDDNKLIEASINRAYRDFNRTLTGIGEVQTVEKFQTLQKFMKTIIVGLINTQFNTQADFDIWHKGNCDKLKQQFNLYPYPLKYGQAQKWINMTLKYLFALGNEKINGITKNYAFFHISVDNIIQDKLLESGIPKIIGCWSGIDNYDIYLDYQKKVRLTFKDTAPMDVEFKMFNE